jgi:drug/metabolite transporter (DMT)-like permease
MGVMNASRPPANTVSIVDLGLIVYLGAVWGAAFLFFRVVAPELGPVWTAELRVAVGGIALLAFTHRTLMRSIKGRGLNVAIVGATFSAIPFTLLAFATLTLPASLASVLMATTPLFTAMIGALWLGRTLPRSVLVGLGIGFGAVLVLVGGGPIELNPTTIVAFAAGLGAALSYGVAGTFVKRRMAGMRPADLATGQLLAAALILLPIAALSAPLRLPSPQAAGSLVALGIVSTAVAWPAFFRVSARTTATAASSVTFIVPMFGILWGGLVLGETIPPELVGGFALVLLSLVLTLQLPVRSMLAHARVMRRLVRREAVAAA